MRGNETKELLNPQKILTLFQTLELLVLKFRYFTGLSLSLLVTYIYTSNKNSQGISLENIPHPQISYFSGHSDWFYGNSMHQESICWTALESEVLYLFKEKQPYG